MADVELVIKIPEDRYNYAKSQVAEGITNPWKVCIANGTPLPKGHGRLIDADALMEYCQNDKARVIDCNDIARFPTIIPADKEK